LIAGLIIKLCIINYGLPYMFHPDEAYIYKDSFKILFNYAHLDFSGTTNVYFWILALWYSLYFVFGLLTNQIHGMSEFRDMLAAEDPAIILHGRLLSVLFSLAAAYFLLQIVKKITKGKILHLIIGLTLILNPLEIISNNWIKFDAPCYCFLAILINLSYKFFVEDQTQLRNKIYIFGFLAAALRIDLAAFFIAFLFIDFSMHSPGNDRKIFLKKLFKPVSIGIFLYLIITLLPFVMLSNAMGHTSDESVPVTKSFENAILSKMFRDNSVAGIFKIIFSNIKFYFVNCTLIALGPIVILLIVLRAKNLFKNKFHRLLLLVIIILSIPLLLFGYHAPHYFLLISTILLILSFSSAVSIQNTSLKYSLIIFNFIYIGSLSLQIIFSIANKEDTRIASKDYVIRNTNANDFIAIERYLTPGYFPPIEECTDVLKEKLRILQKYKMGTGETFKMKIKKADPDCRKILEVSSPKRYKNTEYENIWCIDYDPELLKKANPSCYISMKNYFNEKLNDPYTATITQNFKLEKAFTPGFADPRIEPTMAFENFFPELYFYRKK